MAAEQAGRPTFPVWVGSLDESVSEKQLFKKFSKFGDVSSVKIQRDAATGKSRGFGWVNFSSREAAELSAAKMAGVALHGSQIKTRGPADLEKKGLFSSPKADFRPLTDCTFFVQGKGCKKRATCEYRHSEQAVLTEEVCSKWKDKKCTDKSCPLRHPGRDFSRKSNSSSIGSPPPELAGGGATGVLVCGGKCGDLSCSLSFSSPVTLSHHIQLSQLLCTGCNIVCSSQAELREHKKTCPRSHRDSASTQSLSTSDVEVLTDTSESLTSDEEEYGDNEEKTRKMVSPVPNERWGSKNNLAKGGREGGSGKGGEGGRQKPGEKKQRRKKRNVPTVKSAATFKQTQKKSRIRKALSEAVRLGAGHSSPPNDPSPGSTYGVGGEGILVPQNQGVYFGVGGSDSSESSDEEDNLEYTPAEMAQLLSLNELDMQPGTSESEEEEEEEEEVREKKGKNGREKRKDSSSDPRSSDKTSRQQQSRSAAHTRQPEPVGLFWDIENCSVPANKSAFAVAAKMRRIFFEGKREAEFMVVCDITKERKDVIDALNKAQVTLVHVNAVAKNAADDKLRQSLRRFVHTYPAPSTVVLVSSDVNFSSELNDLRHVHNMTIVLVHSKFTSDALKVFAQQLVNYEQFLEDVEGPKGAQQPFLPNILMVTNLPKHIPPKKISSRLGQLSDNCGGRVLGVDPASGTARILFRTHDWAVKAEKRMRGEGVFGSRINLCQDYSQRPPPPPQNHQPRQQHPPHLQHPPPLFRHPPPPGPQAFHQLSGRPLGHSFPPAHRPPLPFPPSPHLPRYPPPAPQPRFIPRPPPQNFPLFRSPPAPPPPQFSRPPPPNIPMPPNIQSPPPPTAEPPSYSKMAAAPAPRPEGKILIIKIKASDESGLFEELERQVLMLSLEANLKMERGLSQVMWHNFSELQMLLRLDFHGTAVVRKEEIIRTMWDKGDLKPNVAGKFVEQCVKSLGDVCRLQGLPWLVTSCGWSLDEEEERRIKSQVIGLLRQFPHFWLKWTRFKKKYNESYHSALSEMAVHTSCKGAVMILGKPDNNQSQVIIRYEMSPLVRISGQKKVWTAVQWKVVEMLSTRPDGKIKLLDMVREYTQEVGPLPLSSSGKPLQDVLSECPQLQFVGNKPSSIFLTLASKPNALLPPPPPPPAPSPLPRQEKAGPAPPQRTSSGATISHKTGIGDLNKLSTEFRHLLQMQTPTCELPLNRLQQEYQTLYHHSFRVADYIPYANGEPGKMRFLVEACSGIRLKEVKLPNNRTETVVFLESEPSATVAAAAATKAPPTQPTVQPPPSDTVADCERHVRDLLLSLPDYQITLDKFMGEYEKTYGHKMSYYDHSKLTSLLETFTSTLTLSEVKGPTRMVKLSPPVVLSHELSVLLSARGGRLAMNQIVPEYKEMFGRSLTVSQFGFPKLIKALEAMSDTITLTGNGPSRVAILKKPVAFHDPAAQQQFAEEVSLLLLSTLTKKKPVVELTRNYNEVFRGPATAGKLSPMTAAEMADTLSKLPGFSVTGASPMQYVALLQQPDKDKKKKDKTKPLPQKAPPEPLLEPPGVNIVQLPAEQTGGVAVEPTVMRAETSPLLPSPTIPRPEPLHPNGSGVVAIGGVGGGGVVGISGGGGGVIAIGGGGGGVVDISGGGGGGGGGVIAIGGGGVVSVSGGVVSSGATVKPESSQGKGGEGGSLLRFDDRESQRLASETQRLLQCHPENAMTIEELMKSFKEAGDPAHPQPEELSLCLHKHNVRRGGAKAPRMFQIHIVPGSVGDSLVQLNRPDCVAKLGLDLLYLFVVRPTPQLDLSLAQISSLYSQCYGRRLTPVVYGMRTLEGVIEGEKHLSLLFKLDETKQLCSLVEVGCQRVMAALLVELLYLRGEEATDTLADLPRLFQHHYGFPLPLSRLNVDSVSGLLALREIQTHIQVSDGRAMLKDVTRFAEQLRFLLAKHSGRLSLDALRDLYTLTFGRPPDTEGRDWLSTKLIQYAPHVVNLTGNHWVIWAPAGRPYPDRPHSKLVSRQSPAYGQQPQYTGSSSSWGSQFGSETNVRGKELSVRDLIDMEEGGRELMEKEVIGAAPIVTSSSTHTSSYPKPHTTHTNTLGSSAEGIIDNPRIAQHSELETTPRPPLPPLFTDLLRPTTEATCLSSGGQPPQRDEKLVEYDESPYGFLERDPDLLAQLTVKEVDEENAVSTEDALQYLLKAGNQMDKPLIPDLPPPDLSDFPPPLIPGLPPLFVPDLPPPLIPDLPPSFVPDLPPPLIPGLPLSFVPDLPPPLIPNLPPSFVPNLPPPLVPESLSHSSPNTHVEKSSPVTNSSPGGVPLSTDGTPDYLKAGLKPDDVLQELYRVKDLGGGVINPASMEPFLSYFGELSSRELERLESQEAAKQAPKPTALSPTPTKGMLRKKRIMAIRFPGQDSEVDPELQKTLDSLQLPEVRSDSSGDEGDPSVPVQPLNRAQLVEELMNRDYPFPLHRDREGDSSGGFGGSKPASYH